MRDVIHCEYRTVCPVHHRRRTPRSTLIAVPTAPPGLLGQDILGLAEREARISLESEGQGNSNAYAR